MNDVFDKGNIQPPSSHVSGHQHCLPLGSEAVKALQAGPLLHFGVEGAGGEPEKGEKLSEAAGLVDAVGEDDGTTGVTAEEVVQVRVLVRAHAFDVAKLQACRESHGVARP